MMWTSTRPKVLATSIILPPGDSEQRIDSPPPTGHSPRYPNLRYMPIAAGPSGIPPSHSPQARFGMHAGFAASPAKEFRYEFHTA